LGFASHGPSEACDSCDALLRMHAASMLEENGFGVVEAENADAALDLLKTRDDVRLLFTDIQMPGSCDGMDLARQVHARWPRPFDHHFRSNKAH
jgi:two-component system, response regulator PdtaR